jgi:hypothetical protein
METKATLRRWGIPAIVVLFFVAWWLFLFFANPYHLYYKEEITLCVLQPDYLWGYLTKPAFIAELAGDYLTQYYLWIGGGCTVIVIFLILAWWPMRWMLKRFGIAPGRASLWALLPVMLEGALSCQLEYPLSMNIGLAMALWMAVCITAIRSLVVRRILQVVVSLLLYLFGGVHFLAFVILCIAFEMKQKRSILFTLLMAVVAVLVPLICGYYYYLTPQQSYFYPLISGYMMQHPLTFLVTEAGIILAILPAFWKKVSSSLFAIIVVILAGAVAIPSFYRADEEHMLSFSCEAYFGHWDKVINMAQADSNPSYLSTYYTNLAYAKKGKLCDELMNHYEPASYGLLMYIKETIGYIYAMATPDALIECGDMAQAQHSAMLAMTFTPHQRSSRMLRRLSEIAIINGEYSVARKYLTMLSHTSLHRSWAAERLALLDDKHVESVPLWKDRRDMIARKDTLFSANEWRASLTNLLQSNPHNEMAADYLLCSHLLKKDLKSFKEDYDRYYYPSFGTLPPRLYQEALMACMTVKDSPESQLSHYHISPAIYRSCMDYLSAYQQAQGNGRQLQERFGKTYWFYYYYAQMKP